ncbi:MULTISPECIES: type II RES/Xre toxin-antitoxin system antitoxin [Enterobacteriaceae]|uniref:type II RES/Xre toxin-antitoxin system antitoxin n=1 Tax=Enterobacteriaceae TaxID=543 RepID=UPI0002A327BC|nr:DUF2384 domain-containing protein [Escherichia coli]ELC09081.1 hypothetical protein WCM_03534 [Escherichia coli KTE10]VTM91008.1 Uncharacterized conserved protein [Raoultella ornithinolytica]HBZ1019008.1 DUF2384 domain-containing protein [Klebsiella pneumoniae]EEW1909506.1 DUF2384 domain-containing protein [Escherichia coli]
MTMKVFSPSIPISQPCDLWSVVGLEAKGGITLINKINLGLEGEVAKRISAWAHITPTELRKMSGIPNTSFNRSIKGRFTSEQSERLVRVIRVLSRAVELFEGDKNAAQQWLNEKNRVLIWQKPADVLASETGGLEVMRLITRIEHGVYS